jgi:transcriptional regulator with XRE-family HTH domain
VKDLHESDFQQGFSSRMYQLRSAKGVSAREMSLSIGQSEGYIAQIERSNNLPSMMVFSFICEYLGVSPKEFFDYETESPVALQELIDMQKSLSPKELESVKSVVESIVNLKGHGK